MKLKLNIYGVIIAVRGPGAVVEKTAKDFSYFRAGSREETEFDVFLHKKKPDAALIPSDISASFYHSEFVQYESGALRYTDYNGAGISVFDLNSGHMEIYLDSADFLHELCYLAILSVTGEKMEKKGFYRAHGLSFAYNNRGVILLAPSGGGKTSLFLELLKNKKVKFFSDDTVVFNRSLILFPFPLRVGVREKHGIVNRVREEFIYELNRRKFGKKILLDTEAFSGRISSPAGAEFLLKAKRWNSAEFKYTPAGYLTMVCVLFRDFVVGLGLPQVLEYMNMRVKFKNIFNITGKIIRRFFAALRLVFSCRCYTVYLGRDPALNRRGVLKLLQEGECRK